MSNCSASSASVRSPLMAASAAFALKPGVWFRRGRLLIVSPDSLGTACPLSGRNSTYRPVQISETSSAQDCRQEDGSHQLAASSSFPLGRLRRFVHLVLIDQLEAAFEQL